MESVDGRQPPVPPPPDPALAYRFAAQAPTPARPPRGRPARKKTAMIALAAAVSAIAVGGAIWFGVSRFQGEDPDVGATSPNSDQPASPSRSPQSAGSAGPPAPGAAPVELVLGPEIDPKAAMAGGFDQFFFNPLDTETVAVLGIAQNPERSPALALAAFDLGTGGLK